MKTILVLADLSDTCNNTLKYAADLSCAMNSERIILLKSHYTSMYAQLLPSADFVQLSADAIDEERQREDELLKEMLERLRSQCTATVKVEVATSNEPLLLAMNEMIDSQKPDLIMIGSDLVDDEEGTNVGQQVAEVVKHSAVPVLIIPPGATRKPLKHVLIPADFGAIERLSLLSQLQGLELASDPELLILNVDPRQKHVSHEAEHVAALKEFLEGYEYRVFYSDAKDTVKGILSFAAKNDVQLIVALPGKHSFFYNLTHDSVTETLAANSRLPLLILK